MARLHALQHVPPTAPRCPLTGPVGVDEREAESGAGPARRDTARAAAGLGRPQVAGQLRQRRVHPRVHQHLARRRRILARILAIILADFLVAVGSVAAAAELREAVLVVVRCGVVMAIQPEEQREKQYSKSDRCFTRYFTR